MKIDLNLLDNGLDFLTEGLKPATRFWGSRNTEHIWKYSVLNVFSGIELILKHRLKQAHWSLIFEDISNANEHKLERGDFVSVTHSNVIKRLDGICNIRINDKPLNELRKLRNKFEHFEVKIGVDECKKIIADAVRELIIFWDKNILQDSTPEQNRKFNWIKQMVFEFDTYAQNMLQKNNKKIEGILKSNSGILIHCKECSNHSFMIYKDKAKKFECFVCECSITRNDFIKGVRDDEDNSRENAKNIPCLSYEEYDCICPNCANNHRVRYKPSYFLSLSIDEYQPDYFVCVDCLYYETTLDIRSREFKEKLLELEKNHSLKEVIEILLKNS